MFFSRVELIITRAKLWVFIWWFFLIVKLHDTLDELFHCSNWFHFLFFIISTWLDNWHSRSIRILGVLKPSLLFVFEVRFNRLILAYLICENWRLETCYLINLWNINFGYKPSWVWISPLKAIWYRSRFLWNKFRFVNILHLCIMCPFLSCVWSTTWPVVFELFRHLI